MAKVLVTDDSKFMRKALRNIFEKFGHQVIEAENGAVALEQYAKEKPDLITLDITMPVMDGIECLQKLHDEYPEAKVIMCTAMGQQPFVIESIKLGAKDFIVKPLKADVVMESVYRVLSM